MRVPPLKWTATPCFRPELFGVGVAEDIDVLSGGATEQIAILTRLAFARLYAKSGRCVPIILDDALVYSDDDRIVQMFTALTRSAKDQQIIVFFPVAQKPSKSLEVPDCPLHRTLS